MTKKIFCTICLLFVFLFTVNGQKKYEMVIEKTDGSSVTFKADDINKVFFRDLSEQGFGNIYFSTPVVSSITDISAVVKVTVEGSDISNRGICYAKNTNPTIFDKRTDASSNNMTITISGLSSSTTYYVRAYVIANSIIYYSDVVSFTTSAPAFYGTWEGNMYVTSYWNNRYYDASYTLINFDRDPGTYSSGTGYWIDYYSDAPWDYIANHIRWNVKGGNIRVYFVEDDYNVTIYDYRLTNNYFDGYIYTYDDKEVEFHLTKTSSPDWNQYHYGWDYWRGNNAKQSGYEGAHTSSTDTNKPQRILRVKGY